MKTYTSTIEKNSAIIKCTENEVIYAVRYDNLSSEELEIIAYMTSEDLRHYVNRNEGIIVNMDERDGNLPAYYEVKDNVSEETIYSGISLEDAIEAIHEEEDFTYLTLYKDGKDIWCGGYDNLNDLTNI